ncbi:hypothetical protein YC2023_053177 [Brassica napus]
MLPCLRKLLLMRRCIKSATSWILREIGNRSLMLWLLSSIYSCLALLQLWHYMLTNSFSYYVLFLLTYSLISYNAFGQGRDNNIYLVLYTHVSLIATSLALLQLWHYMLTNSFSYYVLFLLTYSLISYNAFGQGRDNNLGDDMPGATCVSCICSKRHKLSETDQATGSCGVHLRKQQELRNTRSGVQQRSHMFQQQRGSLRRNPKHICLR